MRGRGDETSGREAASFFHDVFGLACFGLIFERFHLKWTLLSEEDETKKLSFFNN